MLINILKMPSVLGIPITRYQKISTDSIVGDYSSRASVQDTQFQPHHRELMMGSEITNTPNNVYKAIYVTHDNSHVFESVFTLEGSQCFCLYTKIISSFEINVAISLKTIEYYRSGNDSIRSLPQLIDIDPVPTNTIINRLVPPIFGKNHLQTDVYRLLDLRGSGFSQSRLGWSYRSLYEYEPGLLNALIEGRFSKIPFRQLAGYHPSVHIPHEKWFKLDEVNLATYVKDIETHINHEDFDSIALMMINHITPHFNVSCVISHALDGLMDLYLTREYDDYYNVFLRGFRNPPIMDQHRHRSSLCEIFHLCARVYCRLYRIDPDVFLRDSFDQSSITISKNIQDEICISIRDLVNNNNVCFYSSFPALALSTLSVGEYT